MAEAVRVKNHVAIELALDDAIRQLRARVVFSPSQVDLRLTAYHARPLSQGDELALRRFLDAAPLKVTRFQKDAEGGPPVERRPRAPVFASQGRGARPYLPYHPMCSAPPPASEQQGLDILSSSTNADVSSSDEADTQSDTDASDILSPSPPDSSYAALPALWPSTRQLFPCASQPSTPSFPSRRFGHRPNSSLNLNFTMTSDPPASAPPAAADAGAAEHDEAPDSDSDASHEPCEHAPRGLSRAGSWKQSSRNSRRGSAQGAGLGLMLDISGTRGMMLRKREAEAGRG